MKPVTNPRYAMTQLGEPYFCNFCWDKRKPVVCSFEGTDVIFAMEMDEETITNTHTAPAAYAACESCASKFEAGKLDEMVDSTISSDWSLIDSSVKDLAERGVPPEWRKGDVFVPPRLYGPSPVALAHKEAAVTSRVRNLYSRPRACKA